MLARLPALVLACALVQVAAGQTPLTRSRIAGGFNRSIGLAAPSGDRDRLFVVSKIGFIRIIDRNTGLILSPPFFDLSGVVTSANEHGLLGLAFDPDYGSNGHFYVSYSLAGTLETRLSRFTVSADPSLAEPDSEVILKTIPQPVSGHVAGQVRFRPDGHLYLSTGDGSPGFDADSMNNAQNPRLLLGKILRLDVDDPPDYIPDDNPFVGDPTTLDEIWALGLRNPWRFTFDRQTGDLYIADVGNSSREEIDYETAADPGGHNYGWRCMEGTLCTGLAGCTCNHPGLTLPIFEYDHGAPDFGCAIIGGHVYRGAAIPDLAGRYFYTDFCASFIRSFRVVGGAVTDPLDHTAEINPDGAVTEPATFAEGPDGELLVVSRQGTIWQIVPDTDCNGNDAPDATEVPDCNGNGLPDECDIASGAATDCNGNGVLDECEFASPVLLSSPLLSPIGSATPQSHTFVAPPAPVTDVTLLFEASANVGFNPFFIDVTLNGTHIGTVYEGFRPNCPAEPEGDELLVTRAHFELLVGAGDAVVSMVPSSPVGQCNPASSITVTLSYMTLETPDPCACPGDVDGNGVVNVVDLLALLGAWGTDPGGPPDIDGNGVVDVLDLLALLSAWGRCR